MSCAIENDGDLTEKLTPLEKLVSSDRLSYLPNLYYRQYRAMEMLTFLRADFPAQKVLLRRPTTTYDHILEQAQIVRFKLSEETKYRKAICFHLAKCAKEQHAKRQYKKEERNLFHRIVLSQLAESMKGKFESQIKEVGEKKNGKSLVEAPKPDKHHKHKDNIFLDDEFDDQDLPVQQDDIFDQILNEPAKMEQEAQKVEQDPITTVKDYISSFISNKVQILKTNQRQINRKLCLKKINENLRKRNKTKSEDDIEERKISSATVAITSLINQQPENRPPEQLIDVISENDYLMQEPRFKRKKEEVFDLRWSEQNLQSFLSYNPKFQIPKGKFDDTYLSLSVNRGEKNYEKIFQKNIQAYKTFPPSINSIPRIDKKFTKDKFYNQLPDPDYEEFVISHSKKRIFEKFRKCAPFVLTDVPGQQFEGENTNFAKLFITSDGPYSDRIIYKVNNNRLTSISSLPQRSILTRQELSQLSYFVRKYLGLFGSNWKLIHLFISIHPLFSQMFLNKEQIQEYHQIPKLESNKNSLATLELLDSKILPFTIYNSFGYDEFTKEMRTEDIQEDLAMDIEPQQQTTEEFNFDKYESMLDQPLKSHETPKEYVFEKTAKSYEKFAKELKFPSMGQIKVDLTEQIDRIISEFEEKSQFVDVESKQTPKVTWCFDWVPEKLKNKIKPQTPFRKRKSISEKVSELVSILHKLKQRLQAPVARPPQPTPISTNKTPLNPPEPKLTPTPSQSQEPSAPKSKMIPRNAAPPASKEKPAGNPKPRKPKKKDGKDDDDK